ncbi:MAG: bifunctional 5,10-methylenetetrahydrofolate dehydrogenase/5,10-methenyltetrahydrofolate cyclohydrolase [Acidimicrobiia bacterium]|nr:bifunctional 5,10-methylenetetrahydrofolate dehydrogenase/5,10-methenyltetrahydrofolate cyclohydrolase [Acidimicrobiia bacterium]
MAARILDGQALATRLQVDIIPEVQAFIGRHGRPPGLAIVLVGHDPASEVYVRSKVRTASAIGFRVDLERLPATAALGDLFTLVDRLNLSEAHDGILVQSPLPAAMGPEAEPQVFDRLLPAKDVDGFSPHNVGLLVQNRASVVSGTPAGVVELLEWEGVPIAGQRAVVIGRSDIVGKPLAMLLLHRHATVTICHSRTSDLAAVCREADILVAAVGRPGLVTPAFVKPGAVVVDVGINRITDWAQVEGLFGAGHPRLAQFQRKGSLLVGDVHPGVGAVAAALTPVPGGVGPLTVAMLMRNTLVAARARLERQPAGAGRQHP